MYIYLVEHWNNMQPLMRRRERRKSRLIKVCSVHPLYLPLYEKECYFYIIILIWWQKEAVCKNVVWNLEFYTEHLCSGIVESLPPLLQKYFREISASSLLTFSAISEKTRSEFRIQSFTFKFQWELDQTLLQLRTQKIQALSL